MRHAVIMAGGSGTRLWPLSRQSQPKQLLRIFEGKSLLRRSFDRLCGFVDPSRIHIITGRKFIDAMAAELPEMPRENLMAEPCARDTSNAVGLAAFLLSRKDPEGTMGMFTSDHIIEPVDVFCETLRKGYEAAEKHSDALITFGIKPTSPHTGYGYVHRGEPLDGGVYEIREFREKPDLPTAQRYVDSGEYYWNSGMFVWRIATIIAQFREHQPEMATGLEAVAADFDDPAKQGEILERFSRQEKISVDYAIMEKAERVAAVEMPCSWLDVGSWTSVAEFVQPDASGNACVASNVITLDANDNIFVSESDHLIAAIGVSDIVVIHAGDATVVCRKGDAQRIKEMVERVKAASGERYM